MRRLTNVEKQKREAEKNKPITLFKDCRVIQWIDNGLEQPRPCLFEFIEVKMVSTN